MLVFSSSCDVCRVVSVGKLGGLSAVGIGVFGAGMPLNRG